MSEVPKFFCSYRSVDSERVKEIATKLTEAGIDPWLYEWEVLAGEDFVPAINKALRQSGLALIFFSKATPEGAWTQKEISSLTQQAVLKKRVIPVMLDPDAPIPELLKTHVKIRADAIDDLIDAIHGVSKKPPIRPRKSQDRKVRMSLKAATEDSLTVTCEIDGQLAAPEQTVPIGAGFAFSYVDWLQARSQATDGSNSSELHKLGQALGAVLFPAPVDAALGRLLDEAAAASSSIEFVIETEDPKLLGIPFEAASLPDGRIPALQAGLRMLRRYTPAKGVQQPQAGPLKILVAVGAPDEDKTASVVLDPERELQTILDAVERARRDGAVHVRILEVGSLDEIRKELRRQPYHVLYLSGHGGAGEIELETEDGDAARVNAEQIADAIHDSGHAAPLVYLAACHSGRGETPGETDTAGLAQGLLDKGVPLVLAMQTAVSDRYATELAGRFYGEISSAAVSPATALARARRDLERERNVAAARRETVLPPEYATPSLFCAGQERPLLDLAAEPVPPQEYSRPITAGAVPMLGIGDLIGRRKEVRDVVRVLTGSANAGYQLIGMGGVGKSSVAGRVMRRLSDQGWHVVAFSGRWELGRLCGAIGAALMTAGDELKPLAEPLLAGNIPDETRVDLVGQLLGNYKFLLVLDNFEDNLTAGGKEFSNEFNQQAIGAFCQAARAGKLLITSRYPVPGMKAWLASDHLGPLTPAQSRKLVLRLEALRSQDPDSLALVQRVIGGHPRMLEYLDAILRKGEARLPDVANRLTAQIEKLGIDLEEEAASFEEAVSVAEKVGAGDILLEELLGIAAERSGDAEILHQLAVFPMAVAASGVAFCLNGANPAEPEKVREARRALGRLAALSLVTPMGDQDYWVHRWTAEALRAYIEEEGWRAHCHRAGEYLAWRVRNESKDLGEYVEAVRLLLVGQAFDEAVPPAQKIAGFLQEHGRALDLISFSHEVCESLPEAHDGFLFFLDIQITGMRAVGLGEEALQTAKRLVGMTEARAKKTPNRARYQRDLSTAYNNLGHLLQSLGQGDEAQGYFEKSLAIRERLAAAEPNRAAYQRDLSVSYERLGDLLGSLGQGEQAQGYFEKELAIRERLAAAEPNRADYQRDVSVSYQRLGNLLRALGQGDEARGYYEKYLAIAERLAAAEPNRADYQRDLSMACSILGDLLGALGQGEQARGYFEKDLAIAERLAAAEPTRADYQRDLSVSYNKLGILLGALGQGEQALGYFEKSLAIRERLAAAEPTRADYQRNLSVSYNNMGDLLGSLGQGGQALGYFEKSLAIAERLAAAEPNRADYQRDLSVSYNKLGDLLRSLGQGEQAQGYFEKDLAIAERLAAAEPNRADYQTDVVVSLIRAGRKQDLERALGIVERLEERGALTAQQRQWPEGLRQMLGELAKGEGA